MSIYDLHLAVKATTAAFNGMAAAATKATVAVVNARDAVAAQQKALVDSVLASKTVGGDKDSPALIDLAALMRQLLDIVRVMNDPKTSAFQRVNERQAAQYLIDLMKRFGGADIRKIDFNSLLWGGKEPGVHKTSVSKSSSGTGTLSISTAVAQGKMGW